MPKRPGAGRKRKPVGQLIHQGTARKDRHDLTKYDGVDLRFFSKQDFPESPEKLTGLEKEYWDYQIQEVVLVDGWIAYTDLMMMVQWCKQAALVDRLDEKLRESDLTIETDKGIRVNPLLSQLDTARKTLVRISSSLGFDPSSRENFKFRPKPEEKEEKPKYNL